MTDRHRWHPPDGGRCALLIDGAHLEDCLTDLRNDLDFRKLLSALPEHGTVIRAVFFCPPSDAGPFLTQLADWLPNNGYDVEVPLSKSGRTQPSRIRVALTVRAITLAPYADTVIMFVGDDEYKTLVAALQRMGSRVVVVSTRQGRPSKVGAGLRRQADDFLELSDLLSRIARDTAAARRAVVP